MPSWEKVEKRRKRQKKKRDERGESNTVEEWDKNNSVLFIIVNKSHERTEIVFVFMQQPDKSYSTKPLRSIIVQINI